MSTPASSDEPLFSSLLQQLGDDQARIAGLVQPSLVAVSNRRRSGGAGVVWTADGLLVTNAHVLRERTPEVELHDGRRFGANIVAVDDRLDLAALRINASDLTPIRRGRSADLRAGNWVIAIGHPWGVRGAASAGSVIAVGQPTEFNGPTGDGLIQVGLQLRPGHSGGPMVNGAGELVGINAMMAGPLVGLAVPVDVIERFVERQTAHGEFI